MQWTVLESPGGANAVTVGTGVDSLDTVGSSPAMLLSWGARKYVKQESTASFKLGAGVLLFPLTWGIWSWLAARHALRFVPGLPKSSLLAGGLMLLLSISGGIVMIVWVGLATQTLRSVRVRFTRTQRARAFRRLQKDRSRLCDDLLAMAAGLTLPGVVHADGRISRTAV